VYAKTHRQKIMKDKHTPEGTETGTILQTEAPISSGFFRIVRGSTALALGGMAAALEALRPSAAGFSFHVSLWTLVAFVLGMAAGLFYWRLTARSRLASRIGTALLLVAGVGGFLYPLRFVPEDKMREIAIGLSLAIGALSLVAFLLWRIKRFFDADNAAVDTKKG